MSSTITLNTYANGDTTYVSKMNADNSTVQTAINNLLASAAASSVTDWLTAMTAMYGATITRIGFSSFKVTTSGTVATVAAGYAWLPSASAVVQLSAAVGLDFSGYASGTYYITLSSLGIPTISSSSGYNLSVVVWSGTAFTSVTDSTYVFMSSTDQNALLTSTANAATYTSLDARLEADEVVLDAVGSSSAFGRVKVDGTTITASSGVISAVTTVIGFIMNTGATGTDVGPMLVAPRAGKVTKCVIVTKSSDSGTALSFDILKNGTSVFSTVPTVAAGTASGTVTTVTTLTSTTLSVAAGDVFTINVTSGSSSWAFTTQLE